MDGSIKIEDQDALVDDVLAYEEEDQLKKHLHKALAA